MRSHRNKLLITLVLFTVALVTVWMSSQAEARALKSRRASTSYVANPGVTITSGDPDIGQGNAPSNPSAKQLQQRLLDGGEVDPTFGDWVRWAGRIWATLFRRAA